METTKAELQTWQVKEPTAKRKVVAELVDDGVEYTYNREKGVMFDAPKFYIDILLYRLKRLYGESCEVEITRM
ncbi:MAG: hypothetical protein PUG96_02580 [Prevotellaceae bacterium]|nr:hypothetical protein [Prevotellaceae bacterium]